MKKNIVLAGLLAVTMSLSMGMTAFAAGWQKNETGWWYATNDEGTSWHANGWQWIDGNGDGTAECYYFDGNGYMLADTTTPDNYQVNADGAWTVNGQVQVKQVGTQPGQATDTAVVEDNGGYNECGLSYTALEMLENSREENAKFGEIKVKDDTALWTQVYYSNGFMVSYPKTLSTYKTVKPVDTNHNYDDKKLFKYYDEKISSADDAVHYLYEKGYSHGVGNHTCYADGDTVWVNIGSHAVMWVFHTSPSGVYLR